MLYRCYKVYQCLTYSSVCTSRKKYLILLKYQSNLNSDTNFGRVFFDRGKS